MQQFGMMIFFFKSMYPFIKIDNFETNVVDCDGKRHHFGSLERLAFQDSGEDCVGEHVVDRIGRPLKEEIQKMRLFKSTTYKNN